jgi:hypothetical protein
MEKEYSDLESRVIVITETEGQYSIDFCNPEASITAVRDESPLSAAFEECWEKFEEWVKEKRSIACTIHMWEDVALYIYAVNEMEEKIIRNIFSIKPSVLH